MSENGLERQPAGRYAIAVLGKAFDLLDLLDSSAPLTLTELSKRAGINKATALRILANLEARHYAERDDAGRYSLGVRLLQLGLRKSAALDLRSTARPHLVDLQRSFDETVNLAVPDGDGIVYIDMLESSMGLRMAAAIGARDNLHSTAMGKAIAAQWPKSVWVERLGSPPLAAKTNRTIITPKNLHRELATVRQRGYAVDDEENEPGARCVGAPIFDLSGTCVGAISVSGPASRMKDELIPDIAEQVMATAAGISQRLGFTQRRTQFQERGHLD